jgi:hypothetical protein
MTNRTLVKKAVPAEISSALFETVDIAKKFSHIGILRKKSHFPGFKMLPDVMYIIALIMHLFLQ